MEWAIAIGVVAVLGVAAVVAGGGVGEMSSEPVRDSYRQDLPEHPLQAGDVDGLRFGITVRGYAMDQVDDVLARLSQEIGDRDALIAELTGAQPLGRHQADADPVEVAPDRHRARRPSRGR